MTNLWTPSPEFTDIWAEISAIMPHAPHLVESVAARIAFYDSSVWNSMNLVDNLSRRDSYLIRFTLPLAELHGWPTREDSTLTDALAAHFFWALCWRHLDNVFDANSIDQEDVGNLAAVICRATRVHVTVGRIVQREWSDEIISLIQTLSETAMRERISPVPRNLIWQRATPFLIVPKTLLGLSRDQLSIYKSYINLSGLGHDVHDLMNDVRLGIASLPASWFSELDPQLSFRRDVVNAWFDKAIIELLAAESDLSMKIVGHEYKILSFFLSEAEQLRESLGSHSLPR